MRHDLVGYSLLAPAVITLAALVIYPLYTVVEFSFREGGTMSLAKLRGLPLGFANYVRVLNDPAFGHSIFVSAVYVTATVGLAFAAGLYTAILLNAQIPLRRVWRTLVLLPWAVPGVVASIIFLWILDGSFGIVNSMLRSLNLVEEGPNWYLDERSALFAVILPSAWKLYPMFTLTLLAVMQSIGAELYEAAQVDGCNAVQKFIYITWPSIRGAAALITMVGALWAFRDIDVIYATTRGGAFSFDGNCRALHL
jgi:multiple sugar transport system permease protein